MTSNDHLLLRDLDDAVRNDQPFIWKHAIAAGANPQLRGGDEVLDDLLASMGHYDTPPCERPGPPMAAIKAPSQASFDFEDEERPWREQALDDLLERGVRMTPRILLQLYQAGNTPVLDRLFALEPRGLGDEQRALLLCQAALVRERDPVIDGVQQSGLFHVNAQRRAHFFNGLARWGLRTQLTLDPASVASDRFFFHIGRISLHALEGPSGLTAFHTPAITAHDRSNDPDRNTLFLADHWLGPRNVLNPEPLDLMGNRQRFATMIERVELQQSMAGLPLVDTVARPRL